MITRDEILMGRHKNDPLNAAQEKNLDITEKSVNIVRKAYAKSLIVSSGYRPAAKNAAAGGSTNSAHMTCEAVDFKDPKGEFARWCLANPDILKKAGVRMEDPRWTMVKQKDGSYSGWVHLQTRKTSKLYFIPYDPSKKPATAPDFWDGKYDSKWD